jgi:hypothetical protein
MKKCVDKLDSPVLERLDKAINHHKQKQIEEGRERNDEISQHLAMQLKERRFLLGMHRALSIGTKAIKKLSLGNSDLFQNSHILSRFQI